MKCPYCGGRGWVWVGIASNAEREGCEPCAGTGRMPPETWPVWGIVILVACSLSLILWRML